MVRHSITEQTTSSASATGSNAKVSKDDVVNSASSPTINGDTLAAAAAEAEADPSACRPEHGFHAFDALYCALTRAPPIKPLFPDDK
jgi:hypothetical protein